MVDPTPAPLPTGFGQACSAILLNHHWSGNVRGLRNAIERAVVR